MQKPISQSPVYRILLAVLLAIVWAQAAHATVIATPAGLLPGDQFQIAFVTVGTKNAISTAIGDYDNFVNTDAGSVTYDGQPVSFLVIGGTHSVNATTHIGQNSVPVYLNDGVSKVANSTTSASGGLWSGSLLHAINQDITGTLQSKFVWTGSTAAGINGTNRLGSNFPLVGNSNLSNNQWAFATSQPKGGPRSMYGISNVLTVPGVPEPSSVVLLGLGGISLLAVARRRRKRT